MLKIMFNDRCELTKLVLNGIKTRTSRFENFSKDYKHWLQMKEENRIPFLYNVYDIKEKQFVIRHIPPLGEVKTLATFSPRYNIDDEYAVAQPYKNLPKNVQRDLNIREDNPGYNNKLFVKPSYMPFCIRITDIQIFPIQQLAFSEIMCMEEGVRKCPKEFSFTKEIYTHTHNYDEGKYFTTYAAAIESLIDDVCGKNTFKNNPFVVSYSFKIGNVDKNGW